MLLIKENRKLNKNTSIISVEEPNVILIIMEGIAAEVLFAGRRN